MPGLIRRTRVILGVEKCITWKTYVPQVLPHNGPSIHRVRLACDTHERWRQRQRVVGSYHVSLSRET